MTTEVPTTVTTTKESPWDRLPTEIPTELPPEVPTELPPSIQDQLDQGGSDLESLLNDLFGELESGNGEPGAGGAENA